MILILGFIIPLSDADFSKLCIDIENRDIDSYSAQQILDIDAREAGTYEIQIDELCEI